MCLYVYAHVHAFKSIRGGMSSECAVRAEVEVKAEVEVNAHGIHDESLRGVFHCQCLGVTSMPGASLSCCDEQTGNQLI